ncbi:uncharacterized protein LOC142339620 isoform X2 [Convolutriloba macropyga]|uniref:uncharacterized protein LOC142339620 isoform X2 n=1 Tax=Convolutriloba macropyga TaxID=536237 RepID=UPI003F51BEEB
MFSDNDDEAYNEATMKVAADGKQNTMAKTPDSGHDQASTYASIARCISPDSITDTDDETCDSLIKKTTTTLIAPQDFSKADNCSNPIFKRLPNFQYEGRCKDEFERLHEILSFSPWRRQAEQSREAFNARHHCSNGTISSESRTAHRELKSLEEERSDLLSPSQWAYADDCSDNDCVTVEISVDQLSPQGFPTMITPEVVDDSPTCPVQNGIATDINGNHDEETSHCNDITSKDNDEESIGEGDEGEEGSGAAGMEEEDEFAYAANVRVQNPHYTHRICFISEDEMNNFNNAEEAVSESELNESLRSLVDAYARSSPSNNHHERKQPAQRYSDADRHRGATSYNSRRSQTREPQVATSQSLPMISNRTSNSGKSSGKATTPVNKRYTNVVTATSRMLSNYFQGGKHNQDKKCPNYDELTEEEKTELNIQLAASFLKKQQELETEAKFALSQAKSMAKMQVKLESSANMSSEIVNEVLFESSDSESVKSVTFDESFRQSLFSVEQSKLESLKQKFTDAIANTNVQLMEALVVKDSLRTQQEDLLAEIEDFTRHAQNQLHELQLLKIVSKTSIE